MMFYLAGVHIFSYGHMFLMFICSYGHMFLMFIFSYLSYAHIMPSNHHILFYFLYSAARRTVAIYIYYHKLNRSWVKKNNLLYDLTGQA